MCGIAGIISAQPVNSTQRERVLRMSAALVHRGPDGDVTFLGSHTILAMCRLSIIDLSGCWQPVYNEDKSLTLIANGEIYNFVELQAQLESRGHRFRSNSDVEVIVHLYEEYGEHCVHHLRGMFVFVLWDERRQCLFLARDRMDGEPASTIRAELDRISELIVRSDVPVGVALSGGLDSGAMAALTARAYPGRLTAFTIGYEGRPRYDERREATAMANHLSIPLHEVEIRTDDMVNAFPSLAFRSDDPIADIASYGYDTVMNAARAQGVPVMLSGQGGDELFWGYPWITEALGQTIRKARWQPEGHPTFMQYLGLTMSPTRSRWDLFDWCRSAAGLRSSYREFVRDRQNPRERLVFYEHSSLFRTIGDSISSILTDEFSDSLCESALWKPFTVSQPWLLNRPKRGFQPPTREWIQGVRARYGHTLEDGLLVQYSILKPEAARVMSNMALRGPLALLALTASVLERWCAACIEQLSEPESRAVRNSESMP